MAVEKFKVEAGHITLFARAVGDANQIYSDEEYANLKSLLTDKLEKLQAK